MGPGARTGSLEVFVFPIPAHNVIFLHESTSLLPEETTRNATLFLKIFQRNLMA